MHWIWKSHSFRIYTCRSAGVSLSEVYSRLRTTVILFPALLFPSQWNDQHRPDRHHLNSASDEHGQILEGSARDMRHPEDSRGTHSVHPVQTTATAGRSNLSPVDSTAQTCPKQIRQEVNSVDFVSFVIWLTFEEVNSDFVSFVVELTFGTEWTYVICGWTLHFVYLGFLIRCGLRLLNCKTENPVSRLECMMWSK